MIPFIFYLCMFNITGAFACKLKPLGSGSVETCEMRPENEGIVLIVAEKDSRGITDTHDVRLCFHNNRQDHGASPGLFIEIFACRVPDLGLDA